MRSAFVHEGAARLLIHRLKYDGVVVVARMLAPVLIELLPSDTACLVPIPRTTVRRWRYGIDPAGELARAIGNAGGPPAMQAMAAPLITGHRAGRNRSNVRSPRWRRLADPPAEAVLIDDVVTTGGTLAGAATVMGLERAITFTSTPSRTAGDTVTGR